MSTRAAVFVDRDGVLNALAPDPETGLPESPLRLDQVEVLDGVVPALCSLRASGLLLVCVSNQPAAAKGKVDLAELLAINDAVIGAIASRGVAFDDVRLCLHHPAGIVPALAGPCRCRKPEPGMLLDAAEALDIDLERSWMIGDSGSDSEAGRRAGCRTVLVEHRASSHRREGAEADLWASDLRGAAAELLRAGGRRAG